MTNHFFRVRRRLQVFRKPNIFPILPFFPSSCEQKLGERGGSRKGTMLEKNGWNQALDFEQRKYMALGAESTPKLDQCIHGVFFSKTRSVSLCFRRFSRKKAPWVQNGEGIPITHVGMEQESRPMADSYLALFLEGVPFIY